VPRTWQEANEAKEQLMGVALVSKTRSVQVVTICALLFTPLGAARAQTPPSGVVLWTGAGVGLIGAFIMDREVREAALATDRTHAPLARVGNQLGRPELALPVLGALYGLGHLIKEPRLTDGALHTVEALAAVGVVNGVLKLGIGRGRPDHVGYDSDEFRPISFADRWQSFPSGHTMVAFSLATAISEEVDNPWVGGLAYGTAAMVGWSRIYDDRHWTSDVVAGAILGTVVSRSTIRWLHGRASNRWSSPYLMIAPDGI
jgi:membrane-associated phospholipid phosphatase